MLIESIWVLCLFVVQPTIALQQVFLLGWLNYFELADERVVDDHNRCCVVPLAIVVRGREYSYQSSVCKELITILYHLVGSTNQVDVMLFIEFLNDIPPKCMAYASFVVAPGHYVFVWITPKQVTK